MCTYIWVSLPDQASEIQYYVSSCIIRDVLHLKRVPGIIHIKKYWNHISDYKSYFIGSAGTVYDIIDCSWSQCTFYGFPTIRHCILSQNSMNSIPNIQSDILYTSNYHSTAIEQECFRIATARHRCALSRWHEMKTTRWNVNYFTYWQ